MLVFVHAVTLMLGSGVGLLEWVFRKNSSATTDKGGVELRMIDAPNIIRAYLQRSRGDGMDAVVALGVNVQDKLFAYAIRISG